jgi:DNA (cytosine-5)-methyltransferase 1
MPRAAEFFAGIGLVRLALERQGWQVAFANDIDPKKAEMYRRNWPGDDHLALRDIHTLDAAELPDCDLFTASFPCNDLSIAGKGAGLKGEHSSAYWGLIRLLHDLGERRPRQVLLENVVGFLQSHGGQDFQVAVEALMELGYSIDAMILNALHWTPQSRKRLFVVASQDVPEPSTSMALESDARPAALCRFINSHPEINWALRPLPPLPAPATFLADIVEDVPEADPQWWTQERVDYFMNQLSARHRELAESMRAQDRITCATAFRRVRAGRSMAELRTDGLAGCLRTPRGGSGRQILFQAGRGKSQVRLLNPRECARLQGVPDDYIIDVPVNQALFGFGDAVCVPAIEWIARHCLTASTAAWESSLTSPRVSTTTRS